jgi:nucleoside-diphosphate-sugar epimerase
LDLARRVIDVLGSSSKIEFVDIADDYGRPIEDLQRRVPDLRRFRAIIDQRPAITLDDTILATAHAIIAEGEA